MRGKSPLSEKTGAFSEFTCLLIGLNNTPLHHTEDAHSYTFFSFAFRAAQAATPRALRHSAHNSAIRELPADVAADHDVAAEDGARRHALVDGMRDDRGGHGELHGARVDDADNIAGSGGLQDAKEWTVTAVLGVQLDDLLLSH